MAILAEGIQEEGKQGAEKEWEDFERRRYYGNAPCDVSTPRTLIWMGGQCQIEGGVVYLPAGAPACRTTTVWAVNETLC